MRVLLLLILVSCSMRTDKNIFLETIIGEYNSLQGIEKISINNFGLISSDGTALYTLEQVLNTNTAIYSTLEQAGYIPICYANDLLYLGDIVKDKSMINTNNFHAYAVKTT